MTAKLPGLPPKQGLYDPAFEKDSCGVGFICDIKGRASRGIVDDALSMNCCMEHRGGLGYEKNTGDGAGILLGLPDRFLRRAARDELGIDLPARGSYGVGIVFLPTDAGERETCRRLLAQEIAAAGQRLLGWRELPTDPDGADIGNAARAAMPHMAQLFIGSDAANPLTGDEFERRLYLIRKHATHLLRGDTNLAQRQSFYICSLSSKVIVYKGMLTPVQMTPFFKDLGEPDFESHLAMVHSRFSTNTFPSWDRAQPNRFMSHNGEINTLLGNENAMNARQGVVSSPLFGDDIEKLFPVVEPDCSDSGTFDNVLEFLLMTGRKLQEAVLMMIPEAWQQHGGMDPARRAFYEYHSCLMEPWDGPASIAFTDGTYIGAVLDRNGLRPSRYYITDDDRCIMASEVGVVRIDPETVVEKGRLQPGRIFLIDFDQGRMIPDDEIKSEWAAARPYGEWLEKQRIELDELPAAQAPRSGSGNPDRAHERLRLHGRDHADHAAAPGQGTARPARLHGQRCGAGGDVRQAAHALRLLQAALRPGDQPRHRFHPRGGDHGAPSATAARSATCSRPPKPMPTGCASRTRSSRTTNWPPSGAWITGAGKTATVDITFPAGSGREGLEAALDRISAEASRAIENGYSLIVLSDRAVGPDRVPISALLAVGTVHHHLVETHARTRIGIVVETGEAREVHHHCLLTGYGADAINPYLAFEALWDSREQGYLDDAPHIADNDDVIAAYRKGTAKGMLKVMAKMGISTLQSYKGAQIFEAVGLADDVIERAFRGTASRVQGVGPGRACRGDGTPPCARVSRAQRQRRRAAEPRRFPLAPARRYPHVGPAGNRRPAGGLPVQRRERVLALRRTRQPGEHRQRQPARTPELQERRQRRRRRYRRGRAGKRDRQALRHRRHELRLHQRRGATSRWPSP